MFGGVGGHSHCEPARAEMGGAGPLEPANQLNQFAGMLEVARGKRWVGRDVAAQRQDATNAPGDELLHECHEVFTGTCHAGQVGKRPQCGFAEQTGHQVKSRVAVRAGRAISD